MILLMFFVVIHDIIRCKGKLGNNLLSFNTKHPVFLPMQLKNGVKKILNEIRTKFCVSKTRNFIKQIIRSTSTCKKSVTRCYKYPSKQTNTPNSRTVWTALSEPLYVNNIYKGSKTYKPWIFLITCSSTHDICVELVPSYSACTPACIKGLTGFFSRRATPTSILIDNASNFTADETQQYISSRNITWNFNPPASPWWGGIYKRIVRSIWKMF